jgi:acyl-homoserine lactone acylase PvdQ
MRVTMDLAAWDNSRQNNATGESGHVLSSHYKDQWDACYHAALSYPMQYRHVEAKQTLTLEPAP